MNNSKVFVIKSSTSSDIEGVLLDRVTAIEKCMFLNDTLDGKYHVHELVPGKLYSFRDYRTDVNYHSYELVYSTYEEYVTARYLADECNKLSERSRLDRIEDGEEIPAERSFNTSETLIAELAGEGEHLVALRAVVVKETDRAIDSVPSESGKQVEREYGDTRIVSIDRMLNALEAKLLAANN